MPLQPNELHEMKNRLLQAQSMIEQSHTEAMDARNGALARILNQMLRLSETAIQDIDKLISGGR